MRKAEYLAKGELFVLYDRLNHPFTSWSVNLKQYACEFDENFESQGEFKTLKVFRIL